MKKFFYLCLTLIILTLCSCTSEISLTLNKDNSVSLGFQGGLGQVFSSMLISATGSQQLFDLEGITADLTEAGFADIKVKSEDGNSFHITCKDLKQNTYIFSSGLLTVQNKKLQLKLSPKGLLDFYNNCDDQTKMLLDLFLAPVFNGEEMSPEEYVQMLGAIYGEAAAKEVKASSFTIRLNNSDGSMQSLKYNLADVLCGNL